MSRAVIRFLDDFDGSVRFCLQATGSKLTRLPCKPNDKPFLFEDPPMVIEAGEALRDSLLAHEDISSRLSNWLKMLDKDFLSLQLYMESSVADQLPWEALVDMNNCFLALDNKSPVTRVLPADQQDTVQREFLFTPPLRLACVLGAWWEDGGLKQQREEWESIKAGLAAAAALLPPAALRCRPPDARDTPAATSVRWDRPQEREDTTAAPEDCRSAFAPESARCPAARSRSVQRLDGSRGSGECTRAAPVVAVRTA